MKSFIKYGACVLGGFIIGGVVVAKKIIMLESKLIDNLIDSDAFTEFVADNGVKNAICKTLLGCEISKPEDKKDKRYQSYKKYGMHMNDFILDDIIFKKREDAEQVLDQLNDAIEKYNSVCVFDLYDLAGIPGKSYELYKYGWTKDDNIHDSSIIKTYEGYKIYFYTKPHQL